MSHHRSAQPCRDCDLPLVAGERFFIKEHDVKRGPFCRLCSDKRKEDSTGYGIEDYGVRLGVGFAMLDGHQPL